MNHMSGFQFDAPSDFDALPDDQWPLPLQLPPPPLQQQLPPPPLQQLPPPLLPQQRIPAPTLLRPSLQVPQGSQPQLQLGQNLSPLLQLPFSQLLPLLQVLQQSMPPAQQLA
ncbi:hypothetical protein Pelo_17723 [Pelomyxa schiedti]|nr:hypothetical protein Pelo_17723 [Pelomyxa schiedti]